MISGKTLSVDLETRRRWVEGCNSWCS